MGLIHKRDSRVPELSGGLMRRLVIARGVLAIKLMQNAFFETTYTSYVRMYYQKTFDALMATALMPNIESFNLPVFLFVTPMFQFSGTFFPLDQLPF